jgi:hypothetical protein
LAAAASPQAFHAIGGMRVFWPSSLIMRYSITHAVNQ